jgi:hypothetical protein
MKEMPLPPLARPMTAREKRMWAEYAKAREAKTPKTALAAWARKHNVRLKGRNRVVMRVAHRAPTNPAPPRTQTLAMQTNCSGICYIRHFERFERFGKSKMVTSCDLEGCEYRKDLRAWVCWYSCVVGVRY